MRKTNIIHFPQIGQAIPAPCVSFGELKPVRTKIAETVLDEVKADAKKLMRTQSQQISAIVQSFYFGADSVEVPWLRHEMEFRDMGKAGYQREQTPMAKPNTKIKKVRFELPVVSDARPVVFNGPNDEYAKSFGIEEGDTVWIDAPETAKDGDLVIVIKEGIHGLDTFNEDDLDSAISWRVVGVVLGCFKTYERIKQEAKWTTRQQ